MRYTRYTRYTKYKRYKRYKRYSMIHSTALTVYAKIAGVRRLCTCTIECTAVRLERKDEHCVETAEHHADPRSI